MKNYWACQEKELAAIHSRVRSASSYRECGEGWLGFTGRWGAAMWKIMTTEALPTLGELNSEGQQCSRDCIGLTT